jgi:hypothetical protein
VAARVRQTFHRVIIHKKNRLEENPNDGSKESSSTFPGPG